MPKAVQFPPEDGLRTDILGSTPCVLLPPQHQPCGREARSFRHQRPYHRPDQLCLLYTQGVGCPPLKVIRTHHGGPPGVISHHQKFKDPGATSTQSHHAKAELCRPTKTLLKSLEGRQAKLWEEDKASLWASPQLPRPRLGMGQFCLTICCVLASEHLVHP